MKRTIYLDSNNYINFGIGLLSLMFNGIWFSLLLGEDTITNITALLLYIIITTMMIAKIQKYLIKEKEKAINKSIKITLDALEKTLYNNPQLYKTLCNDIHILDPLDGRKMGTRTTWSLHNEILNEVKDNLQISISED